jgi:hypothetical protein
VTKEYNQSYLIQVKKKCSHSHTFRQVLIPANGLHRENWVIILGEPPSRYWGLQLQSASDTTNDSQSQSRFLA